MLSIVYLIFLVLAIYFSYKYDGIEEENTHKNHRLWLLCIMLIFISGMSYGLGGDKFVYMNEFENYPIDFDQLGQQISLGVMFRGEMPGWVFLNMFCKWLFDSFYAVQFVEAICINVSVCYFIKQYTNRYFIFLIVYFLSFTYFMYNTDIMREAISISFVLSAYTCYLKGAKILFFFLIALGLLFHFTAAIGLLFPFARIKYSYYVFFIVFGLSFSIWIGSDFLMTYVLKSIGGVGAIVTKIFIYSMQASTFWGYLRGAITYIIFPFITMYYAIKWEENPERKRAKEKFYSLQIILAIIATSFVGLVRVHNYAQIPYLMMMADFLFLLIKRKTEHQGMRIMNAMGAFVFFFWQYFAYWPKTDMYYFQLWFPYTTVNSTYQDVAYREMGHSEVLNPEKNDKNQRNVDY